MVAWTESAIAIAGTKIHLTRAGKGRPVLVLHRDIGMIEGSRFLDGLAQSAEVIAPHHAGWGRSPRAEWMRSVRDMAVIYQGLLAQHAATREPGTLTLIGLGFGGWIAAEMATMAPRAFRRLVLVGAMGLKPERGEILDQALLSYIDYVRRGFANQHAFDRVFGAEPPTSRLEQWDLNREMTFRIAWKPYMYGPTLPYLLGAVTTPTLVVWGARDGIVPRDCGERYAKSLANARLEIVAEAGHFVDMEKPDELARLVARFASEV